MKHFVTSLFTFLILVSASLNAQEEKEALSKLSFMTGNWKGVSISYGKNGKQKVDVTEDVHYIMDGDLLILNVKSPWIALHTIVSYNVKEKTYYYSPFSKKGNKKGYKGTYEDGKFKVYFNENRRLTFTKTTQGEFHEYGEKLQDGKWEKYFEDILKPVESK